MIPGCMSDMYVLHHLECILSADDDEMRRQSTAIMDVFDTSKDITDGQHTTINRDIPTSIYSLPVEILDKIICLEPQIAFTCRSLYHIGFRWLNNTVVGPRYELYGLCRLVYRENTYMLIDSFNRHLSNMTKIERHRFALR